ncbi:gliding motility protein GldM [Reichenbachiella sp. MALMAid0571]|uniref:type IX secretion system motor protein PorM/GldM n=1 Tax=Reichenbachiella sp. MALMAid0571 TaxID=3143939 RepID=UPI0032DFCA86
MAGGKQSPRDKMIGMMYLVLTALLALQVSNSVLEKFLFINQAFEETNKDNQGENQNKVESIQKAVSDAGNREKDVAVLDKAKLVREQTSKILGEVEEYKKLLIEASGGYDENGKLVGQKDIDTAPRIFYKEKKGDELKSKLNAYSDFLKEATGDESIKDIAKDAKDIGVFADDPNQNQKGFAELNFGHNTPMLGALASLSQMQNDVITLETKALEALAAEVGAEDLKFDQIVPMVKPISNIVAAGTKYEAELFIAASSSAVTPTMTYNGEEIEVIGGKGKVEFTATPGAYDKEGIAQKSYIAAIKVPLPGGRDTTFVDTIKYYVSKPVMEIQSASVSKLYLNCGNELNVQVPALGTSYNPVFTTKGGSNIKGAERGFVTIIPQSAKVTMTVSSNGNVIGSREFGVNRIPAPEVQAFNGNRPVSQKSGVSVRELKGLKLKAIPDESFQQSLPNDARFRVAQSEVTLVRSGRAVTSAKISGENLNISQLAGQARPGDQLVIETKKVQRQNFKKEIEDFTNYSGKIISFPIK